MSNRPKDNVLKKLKKLFALANDANGNANEAAAAAARAAKLMAEHQISRAEVMTAEEDFASEEIRGLRVEKSKAPGNWKMVLLSALAEANNCVAGHDGNHLMVLGNEPDLLATQYLYGYFASEVERLHKTFAETERTLYFRSSNRAVSAAFRLGVAETIADRIVAARNEVFATASEQALVRVKSVRERIVQQLQDAGNPQYEARNETKDSLAYYAGKRAGKTVDVNVSGRPELEAKREALCE